jgi:hypothetical protein
VASAIKAGLAYFALVFAAGVVLGTFRVFALAPVVGPSRATLIELPLILTIAWMACRQIVRHLAVPPLRPRIVMGGLAFAFLLTAETALGMLGFGRTAAEQLSAFMAPEGALGLIGQILFALFPVLQPESLRAAEVERITVRTPDLDT